jgi:tetrahydromethanopterin S-methyltransferase subunit G
MGDQDMLEHERELLDKTHSMVKEMYQIVVGSDDYPGVSIIARLNNVEHRVENLLEDKVRRDATTKTVGFIAGAVGTLVGTIFGGVIIFVINNIIKR